MKWAEGNTALPFASITTVKQAANTYNRFIFICSGLWVLIYLGRSKAIYFTSNTLFHRLNFLSTLYYIFFNIQGIFDFPKQNPHQFLSWV